MSYLSPTQFAEVMPEPGIRNEMGDANMHAHSTTGRTIRRLALQNHLREHPEQHHEVMHALGQIDSEEQHARRPFHNR